MAGFSHSIEVARPVDAVFPWLLEEDKVPRWTGDLSRYEQDSPLRTGAHVKQVLSIGGSEFPLDLELARYEPPRAAEMRTSTNGVSIVITYELAANGGGTRLTQTLDGKAKSLSARMIMPVVQGRLEKKIAADLERLRDVLGG